MIITVTFAGTIAVGPNRREKMQAQRASLRTGRCPTCGHLPVRTPREMGAWGLTTPL